MKTQLIHLDAHDDHASVRDKLHWARADRIVLVWPPRGRILTRRLDLQLLLRAAKRHSAGLGLVSHDPDVRAHAADLHIPVFDTPERLPESSWIRPVVPPPDEPPASRLPRPLAVGPRRSRAQTRSGRGFDRWVLALLPPLALLALAATVVPAAVVELAPLTTTQSIDFEVALDLTGSQPTAESIPSRRLVASVQGDLRLATTGSVWVASETASGSVVFTNLTGEIVTLPRGTGVQTEDGVRFLTRADVRLDAGPGATAEGEIEAESPGEEGNVAAGAVVAAEGALGLDVAVTNPEATAGGRSAERAGVAAADVQDGKEALTRQLLQEARLALEEVLENGEGLAPESMRVSRVAAMNYEPAIGHPADSLTIHLELEVESIAYPEDSLMAFAQALLEAETSGSVSTVPESLRIEHFAPTSDNRAGEYEATARRDVFRPIDTDEVHDLVAGRPPGDAAAALEARWDLARPPRLYLWPSWLPWLPLLSVRTDVHFVWGAE